MMVFDLISGRVTAKINTMGAELLSLIYDEVEYLWQGNNAFWSGRAPVCFPIVGSLRDSKATAFGKPCHMERHGVARKQEFQCLEASNSFVRFSLRANDETMTQYPYDFELQIKYTLNDNTLNVEYAVFNHDDDKMPFSIGGHPAFNCPIVENEDFTDCFIQFEQPEDAKCMRPDLHTGLVDYSTRFEVLNGSDKLPLFHHFFTKDAMIFDNLKSKKVSIKSTKSSRGVSLRYDDFSHLLLWSSIGRTPFLAIEPWSATATCTDEDDCLENRRNIIILNPGESKKMQYSIEVF